MWNGRKIYQTALYECLRLAQRTFGGVIQQKWISRLDPFQWKIYQTALYECLRLTQRTFGGAIQHKWISRLDPFQWKIYQTALYECPRLTQRTFGGAIQHKWISRLDPSTQVWYLVCSRGIHNIHSPYHSINTTLTNMYNLCCVPNQVLQVLLK